MKTNLHILVCGAIVFVAGCTKSPGGSVQELVKTTPPNFGGASEKLFTTPSNAYVLNGDCDPISYAIEWSLNNLSWTEIAGACTARTFSINLNLNRQIKVFVRARTKTGYTSTAVATVRLILPPTSPYLKLVQSGQASDSQQLGTQNEMSDTTAATMDNGLYILRSTMTDILYEH